MSHLNLFGLQIEITCTDEEACKLIIANYSAFVISSSISAAPDMAYQISRDAAGYCLQRIEAKSTHQWKDLDAAELIFMLEKDLTIEAQKRRPHLYFMHAAALMYQDSAFLLIGRSGNGKSTTCWGLLHHGCGYLSDELAPIDLQQYRVQPYPHALCLKSEPLPPYALPRDVLRTHPTLHVPVEQLPGSVVHTPTPIRAIFHVQHLGVDHAPTLTAISAAEAGMLIYANALNPLSHAQDGLDAALDIARHCQSYRITTGTLDASVAAILGVLNH
ncbi:MAG: hypothetical protein HZB57_10995 [Gammaproteobacteria bacterium]|nr:hypothetical protein [Gammaproteobacteria bacterium]